MKINPVIRTLIVSDFLLVSGFAVFGPIFAIFITEKIQGGSLAIVGFATAIFQMVKSISEIPVARYLDKNHGEKDDFYSLIFGSFLISLVPFLYIFAKSPTHLFLINGIYGLGIGFAIPPWYAIFTRHIDKMQENIEWALESVGIGVGGAGAAALGGILAERFGFDVVFIVAGVMAIIGAIILTRIFSELKRKVGRGEVVPKPSDRIR